MKFDNNSPLYTQLAEELKKKILMGVWKEDEKIPSVRDIALEYGINPNTAQKAIKILEEEELVYAKRTLGKFVSKSKRETDQGLALMRRDILRDSAKRLKEIETTREEALALLDKIWEE